MSKIIVKFARKSHRPEVRWAHVAYHEAGHVVGRIELLQPFRYVTIRPRSPAVVGHVLWFKRRTITDVVGYAVIKYVGPLAEARYEAVRRRRDELWQDDLIAEAFTNGGQCDLEDAAPFIGFPSEDDIIDLGQQVLDGNWPQVEAIAAVLLERGTLTYAEARRIVESGRQRR